MAMSAGGSSVIIIDGIVESFGFFDVAATVVSGASSGELTAPLQLEWVKAAPTEFSCTHQGVAMKLAAQGDSSLIIGLCSFGRASRTPCTGGCSASSESALHVMFLAFHRKSSCTAQAPCFATAP